jgi:hypothetical protein
MTHNLNKSLMNLSYMFSFLFILLNQMRQSPILSIREMPFLTQMFFFIFFYE